MIVAKAIHDKETINRALNWLDGAICKILDSGKSAGIIVGELSQVELAEKSYIDFLYAELTDKRTIQQNSKIHAIFSDIQKTGIIKMPSKRIVMSEYDDETVKCLCVKWFAEDMKLNGTPLPKPPRTVIDPISGDLVTIRPSTKEFSKKIMCEFVEWLYATGSEAGVKWSEKSLECYQDYRQAHE